jgi:SNF2 family DNA or RNA helicase
MRRSMIALAAGMALAFSVSAQVYKWTDRAGKVHYGDRSPDDAKSERVKRRSIREGNCAGPCGRISTHQCPLAVPALPSLGLGARLADDMGLDNTIQVLALLLVQRAEAGSQR